MCISNLSFAVFNISSCIPNFSNCMLSWRMTLSGESQKGINPLYTGKGKREVPFLLSAVDIYNVEMRLTCLVDQGMGYGARSCDTVRFPWMYQNAVTLQPNAALKGIADVVRSWMMHRERDRDIYKGSWRKDRSRERERERVRKTEKEKERKTEREGER